MKKVRLVALVLLCALLGYTNTGQKPAETISRPNPVAKPTSGKEQQVAGGLATAGTGQIASPVPSHMQSSAPKVQLTSPPFAHIDNGYAVASSGKKYPIRTYRALAIPNDPAASQPWVTAGNMSEAWDIPRGNAPTLLAVIDTGFALQHEELQDRWYTNPAEQANGLDDDANGLIDDVRGWDFANYDNSVQAEAGGRHGTYVAGIAAATGNNAKGIAGVDWGTAILPLQVLGEDGVGYNVDVANAISYAADHKADVISLSLGSSQADPVVREAVQYAISRGAVVVAAAGNDGCDCMVYPANYPEVLAVGAAENGGQPAGFSSFGPNLDILAPGVNLFTTDWQPNNPTAAYAGNISGTSLATPIVSGLLTRLKSQQSTATPLQLIAAITENTNRLGTENGAARSNRSGFGLINGGLTTKRLVLPYSPALSYTFSPVSLGRSLVPEQPAEVAGTAWVYQCGGGRPGTTPLYELAGHGLSIFSVSQSETQKAIERGYDAHLFGYVCMSLPHDMSGSVIRSIDLYKEFRNAT